MATNGLITQCTFNYIFCYYANNATLDSFEIADIVYDSPWYRYPNLKDRDLLRLWMRRAQKPFFFEGLGLIRCSMETFLMVIYSTKSNYYKDDDNFFFISTADQVIGIILHFLQTNWINSLFTKKSNRIESNHFIANEFG